MSTIPKATTISISTQVPSGPELITPTLLVQRLQQSAPELTSWTFRKAEQLGLIRPDRSGRFAGHAVHYYDPARIPELIPLLRAIHRPAATLVIHSHFGPGRILAVDPGDPNSRLVSFFADSACVSICAFELRRLVSASVMARHVGVNRKSFAKIATLRGIHADYGDIRKFYDEGRIEEIREKCSSGRAVNAIQAGSIVLDAEDEVSRVEYIHANGQSVLRMLADGRLTQMANLSSLRRLVSTRELARLERMSRYKVNRLLSAAGVRPVYRDGKTLYLELDRAREALKMRLGRETSATKLREVARHCGVSPELLARKVRQHCIRTTGSANHALDQCEVQRIERLNRARQSGWQRLREAGICGVQPRGRHGHEVVSWDMSQLIQVAQMLPSRPQEALFDEIAWACDGAGQRRFKDSLENELWKWRMVPDEQSRRAAQLLLRLLAYMPKTLLSSQSHVALIAAGVPQRYQLGDACLRALANQAGGHTEVAQRRFITRVDQQIAELLIDDDRVMFQTVGRRSEAVRGHAYPEDEFVPGAVAIAVIDKHPHVGMILRVEQRSWNALTRTWDKTVLVGFGSKEVRMNPCTSANEMNKAKLGTSLHVPLPVSETIALARTMRHLRMMSGNRDGGKLLAKAS